MINQRLHDALTRAGLEAAEVAVKIGVDPKTVERWIAGRLPYARHRRAVAALVNMREGDLWHDATSTGHAELVHFYPRRADIPGASWQSLLAVTRHQLSVLTYAGLFLHEQHPELVTMLDQLARSGVSVRLLLGDPDCAAVATRDREQRTGEMLAQRIRTVLSRYTDLGDTVRVRLHSTTLHASLFRFDDQLIVNLHIHGSPAAFSPVLHLRRLAPGGLVDTYLGVFERIWADARPAWPDG